MERQMNRKRRVLVGTMGFALFASLAANAENSADHAKNKGGATRPDSAQSDSKVIPEVESLFTLLDNGELKEIKTQFSSIDGKVTEKTLPPTDIADFTKYLVEGYKRTLVEIDACETKAADPIATQLEKLLIAYVVELENGLFGKRVAYSLKNEREKPEADLKEMVAITSQIEKLLKARGEKFPGAKAVKPYASESEQKVSKWVGASLKKLFGEDLTKLSGSFDEAKDPKTEAFVKETTAALEDAKKTKAGEFCKLGYVSPSSVVKPPEAGAGGSQGVATGTPTPITGNGSAGGSTADGSGLAAVEQSFLDQIEKKQAQKDAEARQQTALAQQEIERFQARQDQRERELLQLQERKDARDAELKLETARLAAETARQNQQNQQQQQPQVIVPPQEQQQPNFDQGDQEPPFDPYANQQMGDQGGGMMMPYIPPPVAPVIYPQQPSQFAQEEDLRSRNNLLLGNQNQNMMMNPQQAGQLAVQQLLNSARALGPQQGFYGQQQGIQGTQQGPFFQGGNGAPNAMNSRISAFGSTQRGQNSQTQGAFGSLANPVSGPSQLAVSPTGRSKTVPSDLRGPLGNL
jgi:hypothetical protein